MVREEAANKFRLASKGRKKPVHRSRALTFAQAYDVCHQDYCQVSVASTSVMIGVMYRYNYISRLRWFNVVLRAVGAASAFPLR